MLIAVYNVVSGVDVEVSVSSSCPIVYFTPYISSELEELDELDELLLLLELTLSNTVESNVFVTSKKTTNKYQTINIINIVYEKNKKYSNNLTCST